MQKPATKQGNIGASRTADGWVHRVPPHNLDAEASILSSLLIDPDHSALFDTLEIVRAEDFYKTAHQIIFSAIMGLVEGSQPVDLISVKNSLAESGQLEAAGGAAYLTELVDTAPYAINIDYYANIIKNKASLRRLIENANEISRRCFENPSEVGDVIDYAERSILQVAEEKVGQSFFQLNQIIETNIETILANQGKWITGVASGFERLDNLTSGFQNSDLII